MNEELVQEDKHHKRRIRFLIIWFFLLIIFLSTMTYAWFSSNRIVDLRFFDIHVETDGGIEVSEDAITWRSTLTVDELKDAYKTYPTSVNQIPGTMRPVSTGGLLDEHGNLNMFFGQADSQGTADYYLATYRQIEKRTTDTENPGDFIAFDIFFKTATPKPLYLSKESYVKNKEGESIGIENSSRVAFIKEGSAPLENPSGNYQRMRTADNNSVYIWEPNYDVHTKHGVSNALNVYGVATNETNAGILPYSGVISPFTNSAGVKLGEANATNYPSFFKKVDVDIYTQKENSKNNYLFDLEVGVTKIRVYMWLEGQDVDSENKASHGDITYFLQFTVNP